MLVGLVLPALVSMPTAPAAIHCVIVDDHRLVLDLLADAVGGIPGLVVSATAADVTETDRLAALGHVDLLIVDRRLKTGDGMEVARGMAARHPGLKCIVIAGVTADFVCPADLLDVVVSVVDKSHACDTLLDEIRRVVALPADVACPDISAREARSRLTARQWQLFVVIGEGLSNKEIAKRFGISVRTVETHRKAIARKLGVSGAALVRIAVLQRRRGGPPDAAGDEPAGLLLSAASDA